jgi:hypothetical protein
MIANPPKRSELDSTRRHFKDPIIVVTLSSALCAHHQQWWYLPETAAFNETAAMME